MRIGWVVVLFLAPTAWGTDSDTDGDGLSDFQERHKYFTDPDKADSDGDGIPDGDADERREYTYTVRTVVQVMRPVDDPPVPDDYQDARVLERHEDWVKLEVIHYPLNTVAAGITADPKWRRSAQQMHEYLRPGLTSNWDEPMRAELLERMSRDGIVIARLTDKQLAERASAWLMRYARYEGDQFTGFFTHFPDGKPAVLPGLEKAVAGYNKKGRTLETQWSRDLFAKGMFETRARGSCTSSAIYLNGCMRALGMPTRIILTIPVVDATDPQEIKMLARGIRHHRVRATVRKGVERLSGWTSHTFNEVWVGGRWVRLNYSKLGQNTLDENLFGMITRTATFNDWSEARAASTVGRRQGPRAFGDIFGHNNPYSTLELTDRFGKHADIKNEKLPEAERLPPPGGYKQLTIVRALWWDERPDGVDMRLSQEGGHVLVQVQERNAHGGVAQYKRFYDAVGKDFVLTAEGRPAVQLRAERGYWGAAGVFYLRIPPEELKR
ncbi:MAG: hypothetical protein O7C98_12405, partial [Planctomycetota bacterium]|nr:hypothetical protein [Planctomycetota bacterium]